ncbi:MAG: hypothetical protein R3F62_06620 [Planctomycetota bacterium]
MEDEAAYLRERVRTGDLSLRRLHLAVYLGSDAAQRASETYPPPPGGGRGPVQDPTGPDPVSFRGLSELLRCFHGQEDEAIARALIAAGWAIVEHYGPHGQDARRLLALCEEVVSAPHQALIRACRAALPEEIMLTVDDGSATRMDVTSAAHRLCVALLVHLCDAYDVLRETLALTEEDLGDLDLYDQAMGELDATRSLVDVIYAYERDPEERALLAVKDRRSFDEAAVRRVREEVTAWALGTSDPVADRRATSD